MGRPLGLFLVFFGENFLGDHSHRLCRKLKVLPLPTGIGRNSDDHSLATLVVALYVLDGSVIVFYWTQLALVKRIL